MSDGVRSVKPPRGLHFGRGQWAALGVLTGMALAYSLAPWSLVDKLRAVGYGVCAQRPAHSYFLGGVQLPLEARMVGIYGGFVVSCLCFWAAGRGRAANLPRAEYLALAVGFIGIMGFDGLNATAYDNGLPFLYSPDNRLRLASGLLAGLGMAMFLLPVLNFSLWRDPELKPVVEDVRQVLGVLAALAALGLGVVSGWSWLYYPIGFLSSGGVLVVVAIVNLVVVQNLTKKRGQTIREALVPVTLALVLASLELAGLGAFRAWAQAVAGIATL